jgi:hypothetical protein
MKKEKEIVMRASDEIRKQELSFWSREHPKAKVKFDKKNNQIVILYTLPKDFKRVDGELHSRVNIGKNENRNQAIQ